MDIGVVIMVKDEVRRIERALAPILDQLSQVILFDTGSTDGTQDLVREKLQLEPIPASFDNNGYGAHADLRNRGLALLNTPWCMTLDADERLDPAGLQRLRSTPLTNETAGILLRWRNFIEHGEVFDDYKCVLFRQGFRMSGLIHENAQYSIRAAGGRAEWSDAVVLEHWPEARKDAWKKKSYLNRLKIAMQMDPDNPRYPWFAGYATMRDGRYDSAHLLLGRAAGSLHPLFPVERLNARIALTTLCASHGFGDEARRHCQLAQQLFQEVQGDFEVRANHWVGPWLEQAADCLRNDRLRSVRAPRFAY